MDTTKLLLKFYNLYLLQLVLLSCFVSYPFNSYASQEHHHEMHGTDQTGDHENHEHHNHQIKNDGVIRVSRTTYSLPETYLTSMESERTDFLRLVNQEPVILNFIFTTCTAICPVLTATFSQVQEQLTSANLSVPLISITIDPEQDTPARLAEYAKKYGAGPNWQFFTGDKASIVTLQKAFDAYRGNKMNHIPLTFIKTTTNEWVRIDGFASATDIVKEYVKINDK
ncbi:SCO family protein [Kaarinaea lacus]